MRNYGFKRPEIKIEDHIFGSADNLPIIQPDGQYDLYKPLYEAQADKYETCGCTVWGSENGYEFLIKKLFNETLNFAEGYNYNISEINPADGGADPNRVLQDMRDYGLIESKDYPPMPNTLEEFMKPRPMTDNYLAKGREWKSKYDIGHKWVLQGFENEAQRIIAIKEALTKGIVCASVSAWFRDRDSDIYNDAQQPNNHWCVIYGWIDGKGWKIFDSYDHSEKIYSFDSRVDFAKLLTIKKKATVPEKKSFLCDIWAKFLEKYKIIRLLPA